MKTIWNFVKQPASVVAIVGLVGFFADYLWKPISNAGLILLGFVIVPWLLRLIKRIKVGEVDLEFLPQATEREQLEKLNLEAIESVQETDNGEATENTGETSNEAENDLGVGQTRVDHINSIRDRYLVDETLILKEISSRSLGSVRREVRIGHYVADALISTKNSAELVEIKIYYKKKLSLSELDRAVSQLSSGMNQLKHSSDMRAVKGRLIIGLDSSNEDDTAKVRNQVAMLSGSYPEISIEFFSLPILRSKWGFDDRLR